MAYTEHRRHEIDPDNLEQNVLSALNRAKQELDITNVAVVIDGERALPSDEINEQDEQISESDLSDMDASDIRSSWKRGVNCPDNGSLPARTDDGWRDPHPNEQMMHRRSRLSKALRVAAEYPNGIDCHGVSEETQCETQQASSALSTLRRKYGAVEKVSNTSPYDYELTDHGRRQLHFLAER